MQLPNYTSSGRFDIAISQWRIIRIHITQLKTQSAELDLKLGVAQRRRGRCARGPGIPIAVQTCRGRGHNSAWSSRKKPTASPRAMAHISLSRLKKRQRWVSSQTGGCSMANCLLMAIVKCMYWYLLSYHQHLATRALTFQMVVSQTVELSNA